MKRIFLIVIVLIAGGFVLRYFVQHPNLNHGYRFNSTEMSEAAARSQRPAGDGLMLHAGEALARVHASLHHGQRDTVSAAECRRQQTRAVALASASRVYRWTDQSGQSHFSDRPPAGVSAAVYAPALPETSKYFDLKVGHSGARQVPFIRDQLDVSARWAFKVLADLLGPERLRPVDLNVRIFAERDDYRDYALSQGAFRSAGAGGYYSHQYNEAVTFQYADDRQTLKVARHETVHALVAGLLGPNAPLWLNEGLAVYLETLHVAGQYAQISPNQDMLEAARHAVSHGYPEQLTAFLRMGNDAWYGDAKGFHYALAYSLVRFLLESDDGRQALAALMRYKADNYCDSVDQIRRLSQTYPGGTTALQRDFHDWIRDPEPKAPHRY